MQHHARQREALLTRVFGWLALSVLLHVVGFVAIAPLVPWLTPDQDDLHTRPVRLVLLEPEEEIEEPEEEDKDWTGQVVDVPEPQEQEKPREADYLAEHDQTVEEETRVEKVRPNPEIIAPEYSRDDALELEDLVDLGAIEESTGAQVGNDRFDPDQHGSLAALPSPFQLTNKDGLQKPVPASHADQRIAGSPSNDLLDEEVGQAVALNTKEFLYAGYLNQIRRLVSFYWNQNLDNIPPAIRARLARSSFETVVEVELTPDGVLASIQVVQPSGSEPMDNAVVEAFRIAGPYPEPPDGLIGKNGLAHLGRMSWTVSVGQAKAAYMGIDPRSGVQFPGILKSPR